MGAFPLVLNSFAMKAWISTRTRSPRKMHPSKSPLSSARRDVRGFHPQLYRLVHILARAAAREYVDSQQTQVEGDPPGSMQDIANEGGSLR